MPNPRPRAAGALAWGQLGRIVDVGLNALWAFMVARQLGPETYGRYTVLLGVVGVAALLTTLGLGEAVSRFVPAYAARGSVPAVNTFLRWVVLLRAGTTMLGCLVIVGSAGALGALINEPALSQSAVVLAGLLVAQNAFELMVSLYGALLRTRATALFRSAGQAAGLLFTLGWFWLRGPDLAAALIGTGLSLGISATLLLLDVRRGLAAVGPPALAADETPAHRQWIAYALPVWAGALVTFGLASQVDVLVIAFLIPDRVEAGYYGLATLIAARIYSLATGWAVVLMPSAARTRALGAAEGLRAWFHLYTKLEFATVGPMFGLLGVCSAGVLGVFGEGYAPAAPLLTGVCLFTVVSAGLGAQVALTLLNVLDRQHWILGLRTVAGIANVALDFALIPVFGPLGAVLATGLCNLATYLVEFYWAVRAGGVDLPIGFLTRFGAALALALAGPLWLRPTTLPELILAGVLFAGGMALTLSLLKPLEPGDLATLGELRPAFVRFAAPFTQAK